MYSANPLSKKYTFLINLNAANNFTQSDFFLPLPITNFQYVTLASTQFFAISTTFTTLGYFTDFYDPNTSSNPVPGLIIANDRIKSTITTNTIPSITIRLVIPRQPLPTDIFQGALIFSND
jgi:hypothetical protein